MKTWQEERNGKTVNVVNSQWHSVEKEILDKKLYELQNGDRDIEVYELNFGSKDKPIEMGVNWCAMGTQSVDKTIEFTNKLIESTKLAAAYPYNGYYVSYVSAADMDTDELNEIFYYAKENGIEFTD